MRSFLVILCVIAALIASCKNEISELNVPEKEALLVQASNNGKYEVTIDEDHQLIQA